MNSTQAEVFGHLDAKDARIADLERDLASMRAALATEFDRAKMELAKFHEKIARIAELERLEPIAEVALRLDALWCEFEDMQYLDETMNDLYEVCSVYRTRQNEVSGDGK